MVLLGPLLLTAACWVQPLKLQWKDVVDWGDTMRTVANGHCTQSGQYDWYRHLLLPTPIGGNDLGHVDFGADRLSVGWDVFLIPGDPRAGTNDFMVIAPALRLPERWLSVLARTTDPFVIISHALLLPPMLIQLITTGHMRLRTFEPDAALPPPTF